MKNTEKERHKPEKELIGKRRKRKKKLKIPSTLRFYATAHKTNKHS
jgi:hypothetical protein